MRRPALTLLLLVALLVGSAVPVSTLERAAAAGSAVVVSPDPRHDLYVGDGGLVVPASRWRSDAAARSETAACLGCRWRVSLLCTKAEYAAGRCRQIDIGCPIGTVPVRIWLLRPGVDWAVMGRACQGSTRPVTVSDVGSVVRDRAVAALPPLVARAQPPESALVQVPVLFRTGQPSGGLTDVDLSVLGLDVRLTSRVRWHWTFGDGTDEWTSSPGGTWPDVSVSHGYRTATSVRATVVAVWRAQFTVEGLGPFPVPGDPLTQQSRVDVTVTTAHAHLVG